MKRNIPLLVAMIVGFVMIIAYFIPFTHTWGERVAIWFDLIAAIAFILGGGNLPPQGGSERISRSPSP